MPLPMALLERLCMPASPHGRQFSTCAVLRAGKPRPPKDPKAQFYSESLNLPTTPFPLRAGAGKREKLFLRRTTDELYSWQVSPL